MALEQFQEYAEENIEESTASNVGKTNVQLDADIVNEFKQRVRVSTNKDVVPVLEAVLLEELERSEDAEEKLEEFQEYVA